MLDPGIFLIVSNGAGPATLPAVRRFVARYRVVVVRTSERARRELESRLDWMGLLIDADVSFSEAQVLLRMARRAKPHAAVALVRAGADETPPGVMRLSAPLRPAQLSGFLYRALALEILGPKPGVVDALVGFARRYSLTIRESEILSATIAGIDRQDYLDAMGIAGNTLKRQVQSLLRKCGYSGVERAAIAVLRDGFDGYTPAALKRRHPHQGLLPHAH